MKFVFVDCEYTSTHHKTTLISAGLVTEEGDELYFSLNDYDKDQVSDWVRENVLIYIDETKSISSHQACLLLNVFLDKYSQGGKVGIVSAGKSLDILLIFQLWHTLYPELQYFSFERYLPDCLRHRNHLDLDTLFYSAGLDPDQVNREKFAGEAEGEIKKHDALYDAQIVRKCFLELQNQKKCSS